MSGIQCLFVALTTVLLLTTANCQETPKIVQVSQEQTVGSSVNLLCKVENSQDQAVVWIKLGKTPDEQMIISTNRALISRDIRYEVTEDPSTSTFTLQINNIQETDAGTYQCQIPLGVDSRVTADVELKVRKS